MYEIQLFGRLVVRAPGRRLAGRDFGGVKPRHILALLALRGPLHKAELIDSLWCGSPPPHCLATVESYVSVLRRRLDPAATARTSVISTGNGGYALIAERVRVDVARFDELVTSAGGRTAARALPPLTAAAQLAARPLLVDERPKWAGSARERYRRRLLDALLDAAGHALTTDRPADALLLSGRALDLDPVAERGWHTAMAAHRRLGDRVAALRAYDRCRRELDAGLGVQPSARTRELFLELLRSDGAGTAVDDAVSAVLAAVREPDRPGSVPALLRRAAELAA